MKIPNPSEKQIQRATVELLNYQGCYCWQENAGKIKLEHKGKTRMINVGFKGKSDIIGIRRKDGRLIALEVKVPKRRNCVSEAQKGFLAMIKEYGGITGVITSPEEALEIIKSFDIEQIKKGL